MALTSSRPQHYLAKHGDATERNFVRKQTSRARLPAGSRLNTAEKLSMTSLVVALSILASTTKPVVRSTSVPTDERLPAPLMRSPSQ
jgi:hypothetical protein